jgi:arginase
MPSFAILEAPSNLGLNPDGVQELAGALLTMGLAERLGARRAGQVESPAFDPSRDPETLLLNPERIARFSRALADAVGRLLDEGAFPVVLGGDCSILLGNLLALRRRGRYGLLFLDGHADFYQPEAEPNGEVASMDLAIATGRGPGVIADIEERRPLVDDADVFVFAHRDAEDAAQNGSQPLPDSISALSLDEVRRLGISEAANRAVEHLAARDIVGFWIHLDVDVLSDAIMPAVDYRMPDGLSFDELKTVLAAATSSGRAVGLEVTIYNPRLDRDGKAGRGLVDTIASIGSSHARQGVNSRRRSYMKPS